MMPLLRPYQSDIFNAVIDSVLHRHGLTFTVEIARQGGKNELSARLESLLLWLRMNSRENLVKCTPTFVPQAVVSLNRLKDCLASGFSSADWTTEYGYILRVGNTRAVFLSAEEGARVVGHTAHLLLEVDEAQDISKEKYSKEFRPMGSTTNVTTVLYGTAWDDNTLLEEVKQHNLELERKDGIRRHFQYDWQEVAKYNPNYLAYVESEKKRLGENHPLFLTQYCLQPIAGGDAFLSPSQRAQLQGGHPRLAAPVFYPPGAPYTPMRTSKVYVAGIDLAGEAEALPEEKLVSLTPRRDSTVVTIAEVDYSRPAEYRHIHGSFAYPGRNPPGIARIVQHYSWTGKRHAELYPQLVDILRNVWKCRKVVVDATGIGQPVASFLRNSLGKQVVSFTFTASSKSLLGFNLLAAVNSGTVKMYAGDGSPEYREFWHQVERAKSYYRASQTMNFFVDPAQGHDDYLMSLALVVEAARDSRPRVAYMTRAPFDYSP
jgi:hypothetical protein